MKKVNKLLKSLPNIKFICWDLDGTLFDTEVMWYNMDKLVAEKYGSVSKGEVGKASEEIAANAYKTLGYRANADKALNYFKDNGLSQVVVNKCELTNKTMLKNEEVNKTFPFEKFDLIASETLFECKFTDEELYNKALDLVKVSDKSTVVAIFDMPFELKAAKNIGISTIWAKNKNYPFTNDELKEIKEVADYYVEDFTDLIG